MEIKYRMGQLEDLEEISSMVKSAIKVMIEQDIYQWDEFYPDEEILKKDIEKKQLYAGVINNRIAVIFVLNQHSFEDYKNGKWKHKDEPYYVIHRLCVNPALQNKGVAKWAMHYIEQELLTAGIQAIRLDVFAQNPYAIRLYDKQGFSRVGYMDGRKGRFYLMEKYLK